MRDFVSFSINGQPHRVSGAAAFSTLSDYLRYTLGMTGTKVVCAEGDCGSCSVLVGRIDSSDIQYRAVCSCIQFIFQLEGCHVVTIEGIGAAEKLTLFQESMVRCHGAQCGFCTPGIVMAVASANEQADGAVDGRASLVGNLCRCTGYESILKAIDHTDFKSEAKMALRYPAAELRERHADVAKVSAVISEGPRRIFLPVTLEEAATLKHDMPDALLVTGATDVGVQVNKLGRPLNTVIGLSRIEELRHIEQNGDAMSFGAGVTLDRFESVMQRELPELGRLMHYFGSPPIKSAGTLGGNLGTGSPIGDTLPPLFVLDAELELISVAGRRRININEFYLGYRRTAAQADEMIAKIIVPRLPDPTSLHLFKVSRRKDLDISAFAAAFVLILDGDTIREARIALGGVGPTVVRLPKTEALLRDAVLELDSFEQAGLSAAGEVKPISDVRGSMDYRLRLTQNIFLKLYYRLAELVTV